MIRINDNYDVIWTYSPIIEITGHIFECFDYYLYLREYYKVGLLFFGGLPKEQLKITFESKYTIPFSDIEQDLILVSPNDFKDTNLLIYFPKHTVVLLTDGNVKGLIYNKIHFVTKKLLGFGCEMDRDKTGNKTYDNMIYLQDSRIYKDNGIFKTIDYVKKIPFQYYRKPNRIKGDKDIGMMYVTYVCRKVTPDIIQEYHYKSGCDGTLLVVPYKLPEYDTIPHVRQVIAPLVDFFEQFDTYIYTPVQRRLDCSPRLLTECMFCKKRVFLNIDYVDVGLQTRYKDATENLNGLLLCGDDEIIKIIEELKRDE